MRCPDASEWMSLRLDGRLSPEQEKALEQHLAACPDCALEWGGMRLVASLLEAAEAAAPPPKLHQAVMARVRRKSASLRYIRLGALTLLGMLVTVALCGAPALTALSVSANQPALVRALVDLFVPVVSALQTLCAAGMLIATAFLRGPGWAYPLLYVGLTALLLVAWTRLVTQPARVAWRRTLGLSR